jgi:hypothetical protein
VMLARCRLMHGPPFHAAVFNRHGVRWRAIALTVDEVLVGYTLMACAELHRIGSGVFLLPDDRPIRCPACQGTGTVGVAC